MSTLEGQTLARTIILALERMAFVLTEEVDEDFAEQNAEYAYYAMICFQGEGHDAKLFLSASQGFLVEFTANLLGLDEDEIDIEQCGPQALSELANVVGGEIIVMLGGSDSEFKLGLPEIVDQERLDKEVDEFSSNPLSCYLDSEGEILRVQIVSSDAA